MCKLGDHCLKRILYWFGIGLELLSACLVAEVCQASKVFLMWKEPLLMTLELSKSMRWSNDLACFAVFDPLAHVLTFLICSFLWVLKHRPVNSVIDNQLVINDVLAKQAHVASHVITGIVFMWETYCIIWLALKKIWNIVFPLLFDILTNSMNFWEPWPETWMSQVKVQHKTCNIQTYLSDISMLHLHLWIG